MRLVLAVLLMAGLAGCGESKSAFERCADDAMAEGHDSESAIAICEGSAE